MNEAPFHEWARRLLEDQLARLGELSNANPRDAGFKLWRQTTLTVIQRLWPGNLAKSERFRRIPFTAPGAKPSREQVREFYDRGCQEATDYLQGLMLEVENGALGPAASGAEAQPASGTRPQLEVDVETSNLAPIVLQSTPAAESDQAFEDEAEDPEEAAEAPVNPAPLIIPPAASESAAGAEAAGPPAPARPSGRPRQLKEMLGFMDDPAAARPGPVASPPRSAGPQRDWPEDDDEPGSPGSGGPNGDRGGREPAAEALHGSAVAAAPVRPRDAARPALEPLKSATGNALLALAGEVAALGVPEGHRAATRAALIDLAHQFDDRTATWDSLRHIFGVVMDYPDLARRVVPMLVPYLDLL